MKALLFVLALMPFAQAQASDQVCGEVFVSNICDVDVCRAGLAFKQADGTEDYLVLTEGGVEIRRDYLVSPRIEAMVGKNFCGPRPANGGWTIAVESLKAQ